MLLESLLRRANGTTVPMGNSVYVFKPTETDERHIAEVTNPDHVEAFLAIKEGYAKVKTKGAPQPDLLSGADAMAAASSIAAAQSQYVDQAPAEAEKAPSEPDPVTPAADADEKATLVAKAKELGIKSPHLYGVEKLKAMIDETYTQ